MPYICLPRKANNNDYELFPVSEETDLAELSKGFVTNLRQHLETLESEEYVANETLFNFSFFTALHVLKITGNLHTNMLIVCYYLGEDGKFIFSALRDTVPAHQAQEYSQSNFSYVSSRFMLLQIY